MAKSTSVVDGKKDSKDSAKDAGREHMREGAGSIQIPRDPARDSALSRAVQQIEKQFGKGSVMKLDGAARGAIDGIPTGSLSLDIALGGYGVPRGRVLEIFGPESSGKTTLTLHIIANAQRNGGVAAFIDAEHALDPSWAKRLGVRLDDLLVSQPDTGEQALEICELLVRSNAIDVIVIDSVAALIPRAEIEGEMGDSHMGLQARLMSQALRKLTGAIAKSRSTVIFINQIREKIGVMFGNPETTPGGRALKFYASVRIDVRRTGSIKDGEVATGNRTRARVVKNKMAPPFRDAEFDIMFDRGISYEGDLIDLAALANVVEKTGAWYNYKSTRIGQGRENAKQFLTDNPQLADEIRQAVLESKGLISAKLAIESSTAQDEPVEANA
jgi:recombination protein RecA